MSKELKSKTAKFKIQPLIHRLLIALTDSSTGMQMVINICIPEVHVPVNHIIKVSHMALFK